MEGAPPGWRQTSVEFECAELTPSLFARRCVVAGRPRDRPAGVPPGRFSLAGPRPPFYARIMELPDALVLGAGGTLGEAWLRGVLNGLEAGSGLDFRDCEYLLGTSAGSIVATTLAAGRRPEAGDRAAREWARAAAMPDRFETPDEPVRRDRL